MTARAMRTLRLYADVPVPFAVRMCIHRYAVPMAKLTGTLVNWQLQIRVSSIPCANVTTANADLNQIFST
jgi:hypothetical protein